MQGGDCFGLWDHHGDPGKYSFDYCADISRDSQH